MAASGQAGHSLVASRMVGYTTRSMAVGIVLLGHALWAPPQVSAQDPGRLGSRILSLESWTYEALERLRTRGYLSGLNPMVQPYRRIDVAAELVGLDADTLPDPAVDWIRMLMRELAPEFRRLSESEDEAAGQRLGFQFLLGATGGDSRRRNPLIPYRTTGNEGLKDRAWWSWAGGIWLEDAQRRCRDETLLGQLVEGDTRRSGWAEPGWIQAVRTDRQRLPDAGLSVGQHLGRPLQAELGTYRPERHDDRGQRDSLSPDRARPGERRPQLPPSWAGELESC